MSSAFWLLDADEDIQQHPFLQSLTQRYPQLYQALFEHEYILCVPRKASLPPSSELTITDQLLYTHILTPAPEPQKGLQAFFDNFKDGRLKRDTSVSSLLRSASRTSVNEHTPSTFQTLNNKMVLLEEEQIVTLNGFFTKRECRIMFDETHYDDKGRSFTLLCIDQPLESASVLTEQKLVLGNLNTITNFKELVSTFQGRLGEPELGLIDTFIVNFTDLLMVTDDIDELEKQVEEILGKCELGLSSFLKHPYIIRIAQERVLNVSYFYQLVENYLMDKLYDFVFFKICNSLEQEDEHLTKMIAKIKHVDLVQLGLNPLLGKNLLQGQLEFRKLPMLRTPFDKIQCLVKSLKIVSKPIKTEASTVLVGTDQLIPLLLLLVIRSGVPNLSSNVFYMRRFSFQSDVVTGELGYTLSSFEAVLAYISAAAEDLVGASNKNTEFWKLLESGTLDKIKDFLQWEARTPAEKIGSPIAKPVSFALNEDGNNCFMMASSFGRLDVVEWMHQGALDIEFDLQNYSGDNALHLVVRNTNKVELLQLILSMDEIDVNQANDHGETPLYIAADMNRFHLATVLVDNGAKSEIPSASNTIPILDYLMKYSATPELSIEFVKLLIHQVDLIIPNSEGYNCFHFVTSGAVARILLSNVTSREFLLQRNQIDGLNPLQVCCIKGYDDVLRHYLEFPLSKELIYSFADHAGRTLLHIACLYNNISIVRTLLGSNPPVTYLNRKSLRGNTALHVASHEGHVELVQYLLAEAGADYKLRNYQCLTAADIAANAQVEELLDNFLLVNSKLSKFVRKRVAVILRGKPEKKYRSVVFIIKSAIPKDMSSVVTCNRDINDFKWLRKQLLVKYPEAIISTFEDELELTPFRGLRPNMNLINRQSSKLNEILQELLDHPLIGSESMVLDFLSDISIDNITISPHAVDVKSSPAEPLSDLELQDVSRNFRVLRVKVTQHENHLIAIMKKSRESNRTSLDFLGPFDEMLAALTTEPYLFNQEQVGQLQRIKSAFGTGYSNNDASLFSEYAQWLIPQLHAITNALRVFDGMYTEYQQAAQKVSRVTESIEKIELQVAKSNSLVESLVMKLSEMYYELKQAQDNLQNHSVSLRKCKDRVDQELKHANERRRIKLAALLNQLAHDTLNRETAFLKELLTLKQ